MTPNEAARRLDATAARLDRNVRRAEARNARDVQRTAERFSSGRLSTGALRRRGHPYARRRGTPGLDPSRINRQSGAFAAGWELRGPEESGDRLESTVLNTSPRAALLESGTKTMFARPLPAAVEKNVAPRVQQRRERAVDDAGR